MTNGPWLLIGCTLLIWASGSHAQDCRTDRDAMWYDPRTGIKHRCIDTGDIATEDCAPYDTQIIVARDGIHRETFLAVARDADVTGIEAESIRRPEAPNYWYAAWLARKRVGGGANDWKVGLSINSCNRRGMDRLHIHIDTLCDDVIDDLSAIKPGQEGFAAGRLRSYSIFTLKISNLHNTNIFKLVTDLEAGTPNGFQDIAVIPRRDDPQLVSVLYSSEGNGSLGGEELFSHSPYCLQHNAPKTN